MRQILAAALLLGAVSSPAFAQMPDQEFVNKAAVGGMFEIQSSRAVLDGGANSAEIERFAQTMIEDHSRANETLKAIAADEDLTVPGDLDEKHSAMLEKIESAESMAATYAEVQVTAHQETVDLFEQYTSEGGNDALVSFAEETLPTLREHLDMARDLPGAQPNVRITN